MISAIMPNFLYIFKAVIAADNTVKELGKTDLSVIGGDNVSDYPYPGTDPARCRMRTGLI